MPRAPLCTRALKKSLGDLFLAQFVERLAVDAKRGRGACLEALQTDFHAAGFAVAVVARFDAIQRLFDFLDQLALAVAVPKFQRRVCLLAGAIVGVGKNRRLVLHRMHGTVDVLGQIALHVVEHCSEVRELARIHVFLARLGFVRCVCFWQVSGHRRSDTRKKVL